MCNLQEYMVNIFIPKEHNRRIARKIWTRGRPKANRLNLVAHAQHLEQVVWSQLQRAGEAQPYSSAEDAHTYSFVPVAHVVSLGAEAAFLNSDPLLLVFASSWGLHFNSISLSQPNAFSCLRLSMRTLTLLHTSLWKSLWPCDSCLQT